MNRVLKYLKKHKICKKLLSLLLCLLTVVCFGGVLEPVNAVAGVDDAILFFLGAFLVCCGMTFTSTSAISTAAQNFYDSSPADVQDIIDYNAHQVEVDSALGNGFIAVIKSEWKALIDEFVRQFPQYCNIDLDYSNIVKNQLTEDTFFKTLAAGTVVNISNPWKRDTNIFIQTSAYTTLSFYGMDTLRKVYGSKLYNQITQHSSNFQIENNTQFAVLSVPALDLSEILLIGYNNFDTSIDCPLFYLSNYSDVLIKGVQVGAIGSYSLLLYKNEICQASYDSASQSYTLTTSGGNVISQWLADDVISSNDNLINCDDLTICKQDLTRLLLGEDVFSVGVDAAHLPGIDSFPSTADDITDVGTYPDSIGISVPQDLTDTISKTAEDIRTVDKDKTDTKDDTKEDPDTKPNKPSIPGLSLPEILFKEKFPFCLPWDVYNVFANLVAEPEAPVFSIPFKFERLGIDYEFTIDLSEFEDIAKISRFFSSIAFVIFLILASRKLIGAE
ncbi:hypothetical protein LCN94_08155 [Ruminococcus sp. FMB-CY1]|uniref:hypothetical protein n=1 Tax=unclassified Ruminococcus TaxID=2608920 RepID=UPI00208F7F39|nr:MULTISPECIES: hypothetical protein [unclassified Ruminococcus]USP69801.1 hypothetical protein KGF34_00130 [Ruminococcus sp. FMBCY1]WBX56890.1 hypothetical protein LCN94_08155 [Ruminococcus sp. FMB-CY1]